MGVTTGEKESIFVIMTFVTGMTVLGCSRQRFRKQCLCTVNNLLWEPPTLQRTRQSVLMLGKRLIQKNLLKLRQEGRTTEKVGYVLNASTRKNLVATNPMNPLNLAAVSRS